MPGKPVRFGSLDVTVSKRFREARDMLKLRSHGHPWLFLLCGRKKTLAFDGQGKVPLGGRQGDCYRRMVLFW